MKKLLKSIKPETYLFIFSCFYLVLLGLLLSYNYHVTDNYNLLFDADTARVVQDATEVVAEHYRADVHPLFILIIQPIVHFISGIVHNKILAIIILSALTSSLSVFYLYKILDKISNNKKLNIVLSCIYLFSFSNMIFTSGIESYNFAALFLIMLWYFFIKQENKKLNGYSYVLLILFGILTFAFTITNVCIYLIVIFLLWLTKKLKIKNILIIGVITITLVLGLNITQKLIWHNTPVLWNIRFSNEQTFINKQTFGKENIKQVLVNDYYNSWISNNIHMELSYGNFYNGQNYYIKFNNMNIFNFLIITIFYITLLFLVVRNIKKKKILNIGLILALLFNTILHLFYGNNSTFLYSLHFNYLIILLFGINLHLESNNKIKTFSSIYSLLFLISEMITNQYIFIKVLNYVKGVINSNYLLFSFGSTVTILLEILIIIFVIGIIILEIYLFKKMLSDNKKEFKLLGLIGMIAGVFIIEWIFIGIKSIEDYQQFLWIKLPEQVSITPKEKIDYLDRDFKSTFKSELKELDAYKEEISNLKQEYQTVSVKDTNWSDYYYFGMANRRKLVYRPNKIIDIETKKEIYSFEEKNHYIIPNTYTVLIETTAKDFIIIKEDEIGVHYIINGKDSIIDGTANHINLYKFENEKYPNIKKVLYGEILFNIKDSVIYPNIIVYKSPWYRDAAITAMVLKKTNNTDLIKDWVNSITDIYDKQNSGVEEADNLGELLYLLSTQEERNNALIDKIENEAKKIAEANPNGYYIFGKTDFGDQYLYQNLWYKLGIESVGRTFNFDLSKIPEDSYSKMAWWSEYNTADKSNNQLSKEYPYLSYAERHKLGTGEIALNENLYPLSWEFVASNAKYENYSGIDDYMAKAHVSPLHSWSASEFLLLLS